MQYLNLVSYDASPAEIDGLPVTRIGSEAFYSAKNVKTVYVPDSVKTIEDKAFSSFTDVYLGAGVSVIAEDSFLGAGEICVSNDNPVYCSVNGNLYSRDGKKLIHYAVGKSEIAVTVPSTVEIIGNGAFFCCMGPEILVLPPSVKSMEYCALAGCGNMMQLHFGGLKRHWKKIKLGAHWKEQAPFRSIQCANGRLDYIF